MTNDGNVEAATDDVGYWVERIRRVIDADPEAMDSNGFTAFAKFMEELRGLSRNQAVVAARALAWLMEGEGAVEPEEPRLGRYHWFVLSSLVEPLHHVLTGRNTLDELRAVLYARFFGGRALSGGALAYAMQGFVETGGGLRWWELEKLKGRLFEENPLTWLDAVIASGYFTQAKKHAKDLIEKGFGREDLVDVFISLLDRWAEKWDESFPEVLCEWYEVARDNDKEEVVGRLERFMRNRGIEVPHGSDAGADAGNVIPFPNRSVGGVKPGIFVK